MKCLLLSPDDLVVSPELSRSRGSKPFEERLRASIEAIGLVEPLKVARQPDGRYLVIDGTMRLQAIHGVRQDNPGTLTRIPAYVLDYAQRFELRYQTDVYQDLLPSQLANLVEHLHQTEHVSKMDIARYIGVSPATVRNYTGLWRLIERGGLFRDIVQLMDVGVIPASNPFAWLRLSDHGMTIVLEDSFCDEDEPLPRAWIVKRLAAARSGQISPFPLKYVEAATSGRAPICYREDAEVRERKRNLGLRRAPTLKQRVVEDTSAAVRHLREIISQTDDPVVRSAAESLSEYIA